jgi:hypothetical protein
VRRSASHASKAAASLFLLLLALALTGCSGFNIVSLPDPETSQENVSSYVASAGPGQTIGQTFTARRPGLNSITLWVNPSGKEGILQVRLYHTPADEQPLFTQTIPFDQIADGFLHVRLPRLPSASSHPADPNGAIRVSPLTQPSPPSQPYYLLLRPLSGTIQARGRLEDIYPGGQAFSGSAPLPADLAFSTTYAYDLTALLDDLRLSLPRLWLILPLLAILYLPGWLLLAISGLGRRFDPGERLGLSIGLSLAIIPLAMLWTSTLGLRWGRNALLIAAALLLAAWLWRTIRFSISKNFGRRRWFYHLRLPKLTMLGLLSIFLLTLGVRLVMARDLSAPAWVDSVHHAVLSRLILEHGGFPATYAPYIDIDAAEYHAGFHSTLATFQWLSGLASPEAMLLLGQVLNALIVFAAYLLAVSLIRQPAAGLAAAAVAGLFTPMPAFYTSWGRYTQLAGLLILPAGMALARLAIENPERGEPAPPRKKPGRSTVAFLTSNWTTIACTAIACGGLFLVHYRVAGFLALLLAAYFLSRVRFNRLEIARLAGRVAVFGGGTALLALLLTLPWSWRAITQVIAPKATIVSGSGAKAFQDFYWEYLTAAWGLPAMLLAGLGLGLSLLRRPSLAFSMAFWTGSLQLVANLSALHLPGGWFVNTISVAITLFLPTAVLAGYAIGQIYAFLSRISPSWRVVFQGSFVALGVAVILLAARALLPILRPSTDLFRYADRPAMAWIEQNIPPEATVLINPMYWGYNTYAGADGGYWITPLTGRKTIPPPVLYALGNPSEKLLIGAVCQAVMDQAADPAALSDTLRSQGIRYVYLGARGGILSPQALRESEAFEVLYAHEGAWVFAVR